MIRIILSILFTIVAMYVCVLLMGAGHGTYLPAQVVFPYAMVVAGLMDEINIIAIVIAFIQYPFYVWLLSNFEDGRSKTVVVLVILTLHFLLTYYATALGW